MTEADFQKKLVQWLKKQGCFVMKTTPGPGVPKGTADLEGVYLGRACWAECKKDKNAPFRPGQKEFLGEQSKYTLAMAVFPENFENFKEKFEEWKKETEKCLSMVR